MNNPANIEKKVEEALGSIDQIGRAQANPFLYTRVKAAISDSTDSGAWYSYLRKPAFALATVALVVAMNAWVIFHSSENTTVTVQEDEQQFVKEYSYAVSTADRFYSINEDQP